MKDTTVERNLNPLDDTMTGRISQAAAIGLITALPDYVHTKALRWVINTVILGALLGVALYANTHDDDPDNDPDVIAARVREQLESNDAKEFGPLVTWGAFAVLLLVFLGISKLDRTISKKVVEFLRRRGVSKPHTLLGVVGAALVFVSSGDQR
ncbi:hypothetical protein LJU02_00580 [Corynebacterium pseudotuberculosis]|uniref:Uncharacterized protein n=1 Tax=Corynebacterium pseudotuberculosis 258 TaxID=1168865 RepID=A0AAU8PYQ9_CORPS|nr:hypothetical protein [Corynebacterium pseudotuberculosis]AER68231.1 Hypothetical protein Cp106_0107 [Corynebacterium pseudotuberculosis 1/06-A]AEQ05682.1 hypothetical protein CPCIP5297_00590 [Corynebacterium pseudotuberculosis CIP 52.97]AFB71452.1 hypothetical protein CP316_00590 [Corynebacterium pseudotuberculosis 316]AFK15770.1 hypothetical protein CP258_00590 [Corynebacterium pseudotuberculosis 258]AKS12463.1 Hypothetical protein CpE19_0120 [Corynebacterium pseudotuberculosis]